MPALGRYAMMTRWLQWENKNNKTSANLCLEDEALENPHDHRKHVVRYHEDRDHRAGLCAGGPYGMSNAYDTEKGVVVTVPKPSSATTAFLPIPRRRKC